MEGAVCWRMDGVDKIDSGPAAAGGWAITHCQAAGDETPSGHGSADPRGGRSGWLAGWSAGPPVLKLGAVMLGRQGLGLSLACLSRWTDSWRTGRRAHVHSTGEAGRDSVLIITDPVSQASA